MADKAWYRVPHTTFDPVLGWVSLPGVDVPDFYGVGKRLTTNDRGFRGVDSVTRVPGPGRRRVICSGDSFTLGHGVSDGETWCAQLACLDRSLEIVNMGQDGYGIDQAFLWHERAGLDVARSAHLFAFILDGFHRMRADEFLGYGKPVLALEGNEIVLAHAPVRRGPEQRQPLRRRLVSIGAIVRSLGSVVGESRATTTWKVVRAIFDRLAAQNAAMGSRLVLVFLPAKRDYYRRVADPWRRRTRDYAREAGIAYLDLVDELRKLEEREVAALYTPPGQPGGWHFNPAGNRWAAEQLIALGLRDLIEPTSEERVDVRSFVPAEDRSQACADTAP